MKLIGENNRVIQCRCGGRLYYRHDDTGIFKCYDCHSEPAEKYIRTELRSYYIFLGSPEDRHWIQNNETVGWTSHRDAELDDRVFFYITAPVSAVVGYGHICGGFKNEDIRSKYYERWMSEILVINDSLNIPFGNLRELFPDWRWLKFPRQNTQIPEEIVKPFLELVNEKPKN